MRGESEVGSAVEKFSDLNRLKFDWPVADWPVADWPVADWPVAYSIL